MKRIPLLIFIASIFYSCASSEQRVSTITYHEDDYKEIGIQIAYMPDGKVAHIDLENGMNRYDFNYETPNRITISEDNGNTYYAVVNELGCVTLIYDKPNNNKDKLEITYVYDKGYLSDIQYAIGQSEYNEYRFIWKDGNLQQCKFSHQFFKYTRKVNISYSYEKNRSCQNFAFFNVFTGIDNRWETITTALQIAGLLGHQNKNLLSEIKSEIKEYEDETEYDGETEIRHITITNILNNNGTIQYQYLNHEDNKVFKYDYSSL